MLSRLRINGVVLINAPWKTLEVNSTCSIPFIAIAAAAAAPVWFCGVAPHAFAPDLPVWLAGTAHWAGVSSLARSTRYGPPVNIHTLCLSAGGGGRRA